MKFEIVGSGAMGLLYGAKLAKENYPVHCWCRTSKQARQLTENGITIRELDNVHSSSVGVTAAMLDTFENDKAIPRIPSRITHISELSDSTGLIYIILAVKQSQLSESLLRHLAALCDSHSRVCIVALQNGIGHIEQIRTAIPHIPLLTMVSTEGAKRTGLTEVEHTGYGLTSIGDERRALEYVELQKLLHNAFEKAGFRTAMSKNIKEQIYQKLLANAIINPLTAIYHVSNGQLPEDPIRLKLMKKLFEEVCSILALEQKSQFDYQFDYIMQVCRNTSTNYSSMLQDILNHRTTEIHAINGAIVDLAYKHGQQAPLNESLVQLIEALQP